MVENKEESIFVKWLRENYVAKDKIRELLKEYKDTGYYEVERVLEDLLKEN